MKRRSKAVPPAARVIRRGTTSPEIQVRDRRGRWVDEGIIDDAYAESYIRTYEDLAAWARADERQRMVAEGWTAPRKRRNP